MDKRGRVGRKKWGSRTGIDVALLRFFDNMAAIFFFFFFLFFFEIIIEIFVWL